MIKFHTILYLLCMDKLLKRLYVDERVDGCVEYTCNKPLYKDIGRSFPCKALTRISNLTSVYEPKIPKVKESRHGGGERIQEEMKRWHDNG